MRITGQQSIADLFGVSRETIDNWQQQGLPVAVRGGPGVPSEYDSAECVTWLVAREVSKVRKETPKDRLLRLQADRIEREEAVEKKLLLPAAAIEPALRAAVISGREALRGEPPRLSLLMEGKNRSEREELLRAAFDNALRKLATVRLGEAAQDDEDEDEHDDGDEAHADAD